MLPRRLAMLFLAPAAALLSVFLLAPAAWALLQSFTNFTLLGPDAQDLRFVGLRNYVLALKDPYFWNALRVSLAYVIGSALLGQALLGFVLALLTYRQGGALGALARGLAVTAWITPSVVVAILWNVYLHGDEGTLNAGLRALGLPGPNWLVEHPLLAIVLFNTWRGTAFSMLLFDAALRTVPPAWYEAAAVVGAGRWRQFVDITLPTVRPQLVTCLLLITLWTFNDFGPYLLTQGGPSGATEVLPIYTWRVAFRSFDLGYGAALATLVLVANLLMASIYLSLLRRRR